jgi:hypothetical protein
MKLQLCLIRTSTTKLAEIPAKQTRNDNNIYNLYQIIN